MAKLSVSILALITIPLSILRAEDGSGELEHKLAVRCAELTIERLKNPNTENAEAHSLNEEYRACHDLLMQHREESKLKIQQTLAEIEKQLRETKDVRKDELDQTRLQFLEQARGMLLKRLLENEIGIPLPVDDGQRTVDRKQQNTAQNSKLRIRQANGGELEAEGPWLQQSPEAREILEQFNDTAKDGALSFRVPDQFDPDAVAQITGIIKKIAPKATVEYAEKLRLFTAVSDDAAQLRRVRGVFKNLGAGNVFDQKRKGGEVKPEQPFDGKGKQGLDDMKRKNTVDDKF